MGQASLARKACERIHRRALHTQMVPFGRLAIVPELWTSTRQRFRWGLGNSVGPMDFGLVWAGCQNDKNMTHFGHEKGILQTQFGCENGGQKGILMPRNPCKE